MATNAWVTTAADVGPVVREARVEEGITQSALATIANVGRQWLSSLESGDKPSAPLDMVMRVLVALDLEVTLRPAASRLRQSEDPVDLELDLDEFVDGTA